MHRLCTPNSFLASEPGFGVYAKLCNAHHLLIQAKVVKQFSLRWHKRYDTFRRIIYLHLITHHICEQAHGSPKSLIVKNQEETKQSANQKYRTHIQIPVIDILNE